MIKKIKAFTLIELLLVIAIIGLISVTAVVMLSNSREKGKVANAGVTGKNLSKAAELYYNDMGFYPPDVGRGWDPGFAQPLPYNSDTGQSAIPSCPHCPSNWVSIVQQNWRGPYIGQWPTLTPWKGEYDYNHWPIGASRYGCTVPPGIYVGVQGDYNNNNKIPEYPEKLMIDQGFDADKCINGESQILLHPL